MSDDDDEDDEVEELSTRHFGQQPPIDDDDGSGQDAAGEGGESDDSESRMCVRCTERAGSFISWYLRVPSCRLFKALKKEGRKHSRKKKARPADRIVFRHI